MKHKFDILGILAGVALFGQISLAQAQYTFYYVTNNGAITITGGYGTGTLVVPGTINGLPVTKIAPSTIANASPSFQHFITDVIITNGVTSTLGDWSFSNCGLLTNVVLGSSVTNIGSRVFGGCPNLTQISVDPLNPAYSSIGDILFDAGQKTLILYPGGNTGSYIIPNSVTNIGPFAFSHCGNLTAITIPSSVVSIGSNAFDFCTSLTAIVLPGSVTSIDSCAFAKCTGLASFTFGSGLSSIGSAAFIFCTNLASLTLPDSLTYLGNDAFDFCTGLTNVTMGSGLASVGDSTFWSCTSLGSATIPDNVTNLGNNSFWSCTSLSQIKIGNGVGRIGTNALYWCPSLQNISVGGLNPAYASVGGVLFDKSLTTLVQFPEGRTGTYTVPGNTATIGNSAFADSSLTTLILPGTVANLGISAFEDCSSLTGIHFEGNAPSTDATAFQLDTNTLVFFLPGTTGWATTLAGLPVAQWKLQIQTDPTTFGFHDNQFGFTITGTTNLPIVVEGTAGLTGSDWQPLQTNILAGGSSYFSDPAWTNYPGRFYRLISP